MKLVVDASAAYHFVSQTSSDVVLRDADALLAPDLLVAEVFNARWKMIRAGHHTASVEMLLSFLERIRLLPTIDYAVDADVLARKIDHPIYDCFYAVAATRHAATLVTADGRFANKLPGVATTLLSSP